MNAEIAATLRKSYFHLLALFALSVFALKLGLVQAFELNFFLFALILGLLGLSLVPKGEEPSLPMWLLYVAVGIALLVRIIPYVGNSVPLGYDPGLHKFLFEHPFGEQWLEGMYPLLFTLVMGGLERITGSWFLLVPLFAALSVLTAVVLYVVVRRLFGHTPGILAALLFAVSVAQFETYWFHYYKNVAGILLLLLSFLYFERAERLNWRLILLGGTIAGVHQVAFFIFGMTYFVWVMLDVRAWRGRRFQAAFAGGVLIILVAMLCNIDRVTTFLLPQAGWVAKGVVSETGGGTFFDFDKYFFYTVFFLPFALTGFLHCWRRHVPLAIATAVTAAVVLLEFFFHNRMIIYLDVFMIVYAALGIVVLVRARPVYGRAVAGGFLALSLVLVVLHAYAARPLISQQEFNEIRALEGYMEPDASIVVTDRQYSPWIKGWVGRPVIAPGLFDENIMTQAQWNEFWRDEGARARYLNLYKQPLYLHVGERQRPLEPGACFTLVHDGRTTLYRYGCEET